jgi:hypothetical protein
MLIKSCKYCKETFETNKHDKLYCTSLCRRRSRNAKETGNSVLTKDRNCPVCNAFISSKERADKIYCSKVCKNANKSKGSLELLAKHLKPLITKDKGISTLIIRGHEMIIDFKFKEALESISLHIDKGYARTGFKGSAITIHRLVYYLATGKTSDPDTPIDHINQNKLDNRIENLRLTTRQVNGINSVRDNYTGVKGVYKNFDAYIAQVWYQGKNYHLGRFSTIEDAQKAREDKIQSLVNAGLYPDV